MVKIQEKINWIRANERLWFTPFDAIFMQRINKEKMLDDESFRKYYETELINLDNPELTDCGSQTGRLERIRSNIVRSIYCGSDRTWLEASMTAYIVYTMKLLNEKHQEIILALIEDIEEGRVLAEYSRQYLVMELMRRVSLSFEEGAFVMEELMSEHISPSVLDFMKNYMVGTCSYEKKCRPS